jgi:hypothetical protein
MNSKNYYLLHNNKVQGPFTLDSIETAKLKKNMLFCVEGSDVWHPIDKLQILLAKRPKMKFSFVDKLLIVMGCSAFILGAKCYYVDFFKSNESYQPIYTQSSLNSKQAIILPTGSYSLYLKGYNDPENYDLLIAMLKNGGFSQNVSAQEQELFISLVEQGAEDKKKGLPRRQLDQFFPRN